MEVESEVRDGLVVIYVIVEFDISFQTSSLVCMLIIYEIHHYDL